MKIHEQIRPAMNDTRPAAAERSGSQAATFQQIIGSRSKELKNIHLQGLLKEIEGQGVQLSERPNFQELNKFKGLVKQFMEEVTQKGVGLYQTDSWDPYGGNRTLKTVQVIDQKLVELTDSILQQQSDGLSILERIGEIKGLLINLYR